MHCLALSYDNKIYSWGVNDHGALGRDTSSGVKETAIDADSDSEDDDDIGLNEKESTPAAIPSSSFPVGTRFAQVVALGSASFALTTTGLVYGWGTFSVSSFQYWCGLMLTSSGIGWRYWIYQREDGCSRQGQQEGHTTNAHTY
jgi:alpha-tubulin suppressor-like RCC1 family protein